MDGGVPPDDNAVALRLANLLASRLCHDLNGPLSGLGAALGELGVDPAALELAQDAATVLRQRIALFHTAFGSSPGPLTRGALRDLAAGLPNARRLYLEFEALAEATSFTPAAAQVVASALLLAAEGLPGGGMLALAGDPAGVVVITIAGPRAAWPAGFGAMLTDATVAWEAIAAIELPTGLRLLAGPLTALLAHRAGLRGALLLAPNPELAPPLLLDCSARRGA